MVSQPPYIALFKRSAYKAMTRMDDPYQFASSSPLLLPSKDKLNKAQTTQTSSSSITAN